MNQEDSEQNEVDGMKKGAKFALCNLYVARNSTFCPTGNQSSIPCNRASIFLLFPLSSKK